MRPNRQNRPNTQKQRASNQVTVKSAQTNAIPAQQKKQQASTPVTVKSARTNAIPTQQQQTQAAVKPQSNEYWHGFVLGNESIDKNILTATTVDQKTYNLIGIIQDGANFNYGFINKPDPDYECGEQKKYYTELMSRISAKNKIKQDANLVDIFSFILFNKFFNTDSENGSKLEILKEIAAFLITGKSEELIKLLPPDELLQHTGFDSVSRPDLTESNSFKTDSIISIINKSKSPIINLLTSSSPTDPKYSINKTFFYILTIFAKQHPFKSCENKNKIANPNELYTRHLSSLLGQDINAANVNEFLTELSNLDVNSIYPISALRTKTYTYQIVLSNQTENPTFLKTTIQKNGKYDIKYYFCIIAIESTSVVNIVTNDRIDATKLKDTLKSTQGPWSFVSSISISNPQEGGDPPDNEAQIGGNFITNILSHKKNKTLRSLKNVKRLELW